MVHINSCAVLNILKLSNSQLDPDPFYSAKSSQRIPFGCGSGLRINQILDPTLSNPFSSISINKYYSKNVAIIEVIFFCLKSNRNTEIKLAGYTLHGNFESGF